MPQNITATVFAGSSDQNFSAYPPYDANGNGAPLDDTSFYVALPWNMSSAAERERGVKVTNRKNGASAVGQVMDKGPWLVDDNYAAIGTRPIAETCYKTHMPLPRGPNKGRVPSNPAGIDLSPALAAAIDVDGMGQVDWEPYTEDETVMVTPVRRVLDLSHHNTIPTMADFDKIKEAGIWGIIHKATESTNFRDDAYPSRKVAFLDRGFLWGAYHFFHPGNVSAQVDYFLNYAGVDDQTLYALDWEASSSGTANSAQAEEFCRRMEDKTGRTCVIYSGNVAKEKISGVNTYLGSHRLWLAQYSSNPVCQASWNDWWIWQYSDGQQGPQPRGCPGVSGHVDTNSWPGTQEELRAQWSGTGTAPIPPEPPEDVAEVSMTVSSTTPIRLTIVKGDNVT